MANVQIHAFRSDGEMSPGAAAALAGYFDVDAAVQDYLTLNPPAGVVDATTGGKGVLRLSGDLGGTAETPTVPGLAGKVGKGDLVVNVKDYGATGDGTTDDTAAITAAVNAIPVGQSGTVYFPACSAFYRVTSPLPARSYLTYRGDGQYTIIRVTSGAMWTPTAPMTHNAWVDLQLQSDAGHIYNLGATGAMFQNTWSRVTFVTYGASVSVVYLNGSGDFIDNTWDACDFHRDSTSTVPGFDLTNTGGGLGSNRWYRSRVTSNGASGYYWKLVQTGTGSYAYENVWRDITGEINPDGIIWLMSPHGATIDNVRDNDTATYTSSLFKIGRSAPGGYPGEVRITNSGNRGGTLNGTTVFHVEVVDALASPLLLDRVSDHFGNSYISTVDGYGASILDASGASGVLATYTGSTALDQAAVGTAVFNGSSLTATLPDPTTIRPGRCFTVKNIHSTSLTVASAGTSKTLDGAASQSLAQWAKATYVSNGAQWLTI